VLTGGRQPEGRDGFYYQPTVIDCDSPAIASVQEELFGPVLSVLTFRTEDEAVTLANDTKYGLASGVFTRDLARAHRMTRRIRAGVVWVNTYRVISPQIPFDGMSGYGREGGAESIRDYLRQKSVWINTSTAPIADPFVMR
jgi:acyl-CoA reductase-like NAD-dependent aldehyde dehydrogenase